MRRAAILMATLAAILVPDAAARAQSSAYLDLRGPSCRPVRGLDGAADCEGPAGHVLRVEGGGASDAVTFRPRRGDAVPVSPPPGRDYPNGPSTVGAVAEWRVENARPIGLILRRRVEGQRSRLEVYKLDGARLCWIANVGEAEGGNVQARRLAGTYRDLPCP